MKRVKQKFAVLAVALLLVVIIADPATAVIWELDCDSGAVFTWQAIVTDSAGDPIPSGDYELIYCYYEDSAGFNLIGCCTTTATVGTPSRGSGDDKAAFGGSALAELTYAQPIWEDTTKVGHFPKMTVMPDIWLELTFNGETMSPLTLVTSVPNSGTAQRVLGDIYTAPGRALIVEPPQASSGMVDILGNDTVASVALYRPTDDTLPMIIMEVTEAASILAVFDTSRNTTISITGDGAGTFDGLVWSKTGFKFPDLTVQTTAWTGGGTCNWSVTNSVLHTNNWWGIARGWAGNILEGDSIFTVVNLGVACTTGFDYLTGNYLTVSGGLGNRAGTDYSTVGGGRQNAAYGGGSTISGGEQNSANGWRSTVSGGYSNTIYGRYGGISSGYSNLVGDEVEDTAACVGGGYENSATAKYSTVSGGKLNTASGSKSTVGGGEGNVASGYVSTVGGGRDNVADTFYSTVGGGYDNSATAPYATVGGGTDNDASNRSSTVGGGYNNTASNTFSTVGGGGGNTANDYSSTVSGGSDNTATNAWSTVSGGYGNTASGTFTTVSGGQQNTASGDYATVGGGGSNTASGLGSAVGGGSRNSNAGDYSVIPGGYYDTLTSNADYSMAFGRGVYVNSPYQVVFFDGDNSGWFGLNRDDHDTIGLPIHVGTNTGNGNGAYLTHGGTWTNSSSREFKENFQQLDGKEVLNRIDNLPIESWEYKGTGERHIWPCAEDFHKVFDVGVLKEDGTRDTKYLAAGDVAGVALAGVKELAKDNQELRERIVQLEALVEALLAQQDGSNEPKAEFGMNK